MTVESGTPAPTSNSMAAFSRQLDQLADSLSLLYIKNNAGGRRIFRDKWPEVAEYIFGDELTAFDMNGVKDDDDRARRSQLEDDADMRRIELKQVMSELVEKSVDAGSLQFEYVGEVVDKFGPLLSQFLYEESIIERVRPGTLEVAREAMEAKKEQQAKGGQAAAPEQVAPVEPQVTEEQASDTPDEPAQAEGGEVADQPVENQQEAPIEQNSGEEKRQDKTEVQKIPEFDPEQAPVQQNEVSTALEELSAQQSEPESVPEELSKPQEPLAEPFEVNHIQPQVSEGSSVEDDRLSAEEVELLSNKEPEAPVSETVPNDTGSELDTNELSETLETPEIQKDEPVSQIVEEPQKPAEQAVVPEQEEDPLDHVRPIETPVPESVVPEGEAAQDVFPKEPEQSIESAVPEAVPSEPPQIEPVVESQPVEQVSQPEQEAVEAAPEPIFDNEIAKVQQVEAEEQASEVIANATEGSIEEEQLHAAAAVREMLGDEEQSLVAPELLNLEEAMAAQSMPGTDELIAKGVLQEGDLSEEPKPEVEAVQDVLPKEPEQSIESVVPEAVLSEPKQAEPVAEPQPVEQVSRPEQEAVEAAPEPLFDDEIAKAQQTQPEEKAPEAEVQPVVQEDIVQKDPVPPIEENVLQEEQPEVRQNPVEQAASVQPASGSEKIVEPVAEPQSEEQVSQPEQEAVEAVPEPFFDDEIARAQTVQPQPVEPVQQSVEEVSPQPEQPPSDAMSGPAVQLDPEPVEAVRSEAEESSDEQEDSSGPDTADTMTNSSQEVTKPRE